MSCGEQGGRDGCYASGLSPLVHHNTRAHSLLLTLQKKHPVPQNQSVNKPGLEGKVPDSSHSGCFSWFEEPGWDRLASGSQSCCLRLSNSGIAGMRHPARLFLKHQLLGSLERTKGMGNLNGISYREGKEGSGNTQRFKSATILSVLLILAPAPWWREYYCAQGSANGAVRSLWGLLPFTHSASPSWWFTWGRKQEDL